MIYIINGSEHMAKWISVQLPSDLVSEVKEAIKERPELGYSSFAEFVKDSVRSRLSTLRNSRPRLEHLNLYENHVKILDNLRDRMASVYFNGDGFVFCDLCGSNDCVHIEFALDLPEVQKALKERKWIDKRPKRKMP